MKRRQKTEVLQVRLDSEESRAIEWCALRVGMTKSAFVRSALRAIAKREGAFVK